jgi:hypothetical protein
LAGQDRFRIPVHRTAVLEDLDVEIHGHLAQVPPIGAGR